MTGDFKYREAFCYMLGYMAMNTKNGSTMSKSDITAMLIKIRRDFEVELPQSVIVAFMPERSAA